MPAAFASAIASAMTAACARCQSSDGAPHPVENQISSQQPGCRAISEKLDFQISDVSVSFALSLIAISGDAPTLQTIKTANIAAARIVPHEVLILSFPFYFLVHPVIFVLLLGILKWTFYNGFAGSVTTRLKIPTTHPILRPRHSRAPPTCERSRTKRNRTCRKASRRRRAPSARARIRLRQEAPHEGSCRG